MFMNFRTVGRCGSGSLDCILQRYRLMMDGHFAGIYVLLYWVAAVFLGILHTLVDSCAVFRESHRSAKLSQDCVSISELFRSCLPIALKRYFVNGTACLLEYDQHPCGVLVWLQHWCHLQIKGSSVRFSTSALGIFLLNAKHTSHVAKVETFQVSSHGPNVWPKLRLNKARDWVRGLFIPASWFSLSNFCLIRPSFGDFDDPWIDLWLGGEIEVDYVLALHVNVRRGSQCLDKSLQSWSETNSSHENQPIGLSRTSFLCVALTVLLANYLSYGGWPDLGFCSDSGLPSNFLCRCALPSILLKALNKSMVKNIPKMVGARTQLCFNSAGNGCSVVADYTVHD